MSFLLARFMLFLEGGMLLIKKMNKHGFQSVFKD